MKNQTKIEKIKGNYALIGIIIVALIGSGGLIYRFLPNKTAATEQNKVEIKDNKNSPVANKIETQNNYYSDSPSIKNTQQKTTKVQQQKISIPSSKDQSTPQKKETTINANNALIVTNEQTGGLNTVNVQQIPNPTVQVQQLNTYNIVVKEIIDTRIPGRKIIALPSQQYKFDSLYKTELLVSYTCPVNLNATGFIIKREDVIYHGITHSGRTQWQTGNWQGKWPFYILTQPENGNYTFTIYTVNPFGNPAVEFDYLK